LPALLGSVFSLCGHAHRLAASAAVAAAQGRAAAASAAQRQQLLAETARDHLQRMALDWPLHLVPGAAPQGPAAAWLAGSPFITHVHAPAQSLAAASAWLQQAVLGQSPGDWLAAFQAEGEAALLRWCQRQAPALAVPWLLHSAAAPARELATPCKPWRPLSDAPLHMAALARSLQEETFVLQPSWQGQAAETGPWTRHAAPLQAHNAWMRLASRLVDLVALVHAYSAGPRDEPAESAALAQGALTLADGEGLAWLEMARGLLVHWVRLDEQQRVVDLRVLAPTEWNMHPQGSLARALAALPARGPHAAAQARLLAAAFDPCVEFEVLLQPEAGVAHA
jgi:hypothetical protein